MALAGSNAGMRLIAQCSLLKRGDEARLREFLRSGYTEAALQQSPAAQRLADLQAAQARYGSLKPTQVLALEKHRALVLLQAQQGGDLPALRADGRGGLSPPHHRIQSAGDGGGNKMRAIAYVIFQRQITLAVMATGFGGRWADAFSRRPI